MSAPVVTPDMYLHALELGDDELARWYAEQLDAESTRAAEWYDRPDALLRSALHYVTRYGLRVFPLTPGQKVPLSKRLACCHGSHRRGGFHDASDHPDAVRTWWAEHPTANIGIATGHRVDVIDQDGTTGALAWLRGQGWPTVLGVATTRRAGGVHRYVTATGMGNGAGIAPGIDYRGLGGYVVAPPSIIEGTRYAWVAPLDLEPVTR